MKFAICNETFVDWEWERMLECIAQLGYDGVEVAPFTLADRATDISDQRRRDLRHAAQRAGVKVIGLHWLLVKPGGLSISTADDQARKRTLDVMLAFIDQCAELGGRYLVHGSPHQRRIDPGDTRAAALARAQDCFARAAERAAKAGVVYCVEPLSSDQTPLINTLEEAAQIVEAVGNPALKTMLDCSAAGRMEKEPLAALVERWLPKGVIAHVQVNDRNRQGPGQGEQRFAPLIGALRRHGYGGDLAVEPFDYVPDGPAAAARAIGYIRGIVEALETR